MAGPAAEGEHILQASGRIDAGTAPLLDEQLRALQSAGARRVALDLSQVTYLSSSGMRVLLLAQRRQEAVGGTLSLRDIPCRILRVLRVAGFDRVLQIEASDSNYHDDPIA